VGGEAFLYHKFQPFDVDWMAKILSMMYVKRVLEPTAVTNSYLIVKIRGATFND
jgi:hypothetical protein